jgi:hypothetical protein
MSPVLRALVDADQRRPGPTDGDRQRVYAALGASLGIVPAGAIVAAHAASASAAATTGAATASTGAVATAVSTASTVGPLALLTKAPLLSVGVGALLGATLAAYVVKGPAARWTAAARARRAAATALVAPRSVAAPAPPAEAPAAAQLVAEKPAALEEKPPIAPPARTPTVTHHAVAPTAKPAARAGETRTDEATATGTPSSAAGLLAAEQALLDPARAAIARGDGRGALARLALHEHRFANGALAQEREAMTIRALVLAGDRDSARRRADTFQTRYPGSLLWPMITATLDAPSGSSR